MRLNGAGVGLPQPPVSGCGKGQQGGRGQRHNVPRVDRGAYVAAELGVAERGIGGFDSGDLVPGRGHQRFLVVLDDPGPEAGDHAVARVAVELREPARSLRVQRVVVDVGTRIQRRTDGGLALRIDLVGLILPGVEPVT